MSVLIKGLHKPDENHHCPFVDAEYGYCLVDLGITGRGEKCEYMNDCPLIPIPDHGDLVDVDLLKAECKEPNVWWETEHQMGYVLAAAQVIIPAERSEE